MAGASKQKQTLQSRQLLNTLKPQLRDTTILPRAHGTTRYVGKISLWSWSDCRKQKSQRGWFLLHRVVTLFRRRRRISLTASADNTEDYRVHSTSEW